MVTLRFSPTGGEPTEQVADGSVEDEVEEPAAVRDAVLEPDLAVVVQPPAEVHQSVEPGELDDFDHVGIRHGNITRYGLVHLVGSLFS